MVRAILRDIRDSVGEGSNDGFTRGVGSAIEGDADSRCGFCRSESFAELDNSQPQCACWLREGAVERWLECRILAVAFVPFESVCDVLFADMF